MYALRLTSLKQHQFLKIFVAGLSGAKDLLQRLFFFYQSAYLNWPSSCFRKEESLEAALFAAWIFVADALNFRVPEGLRRDFFFKIPLQFRLEVISREPVAVMRERGVIRIFFFSSFFGIRTLLPYI